MSQLTDQIKAYGEAQAAEFCRGAPEFEVFNLLWEDPQQIIPVCEKMGWQTLDELMAWCNNVTAAVGNIKVFTQLIDPPVMIVPPAETEFHPIHQKLFDMGLLPSDLQINQTDRIYKLPTKAQWEYIAAACPVRFRTYSKGSESFDCDEFTKAMIGWIALKCGNVAAGFAGTRHFFGTSLQGGHACVVVMDNNRDIWFIEPQTGKLHSPAEAVRLGGNFFATRMELARVYF